MIFENKGGNMKEQIKVNGQWLDIYEIGQLVVVVQHTNGLWHLELIHKSKVEGWRLA